VTDRLKEYGEVKIYVVGRPSFDEKTFAGFLEQYGLAWRRTPVVSEAQELIETAGRLCYMSFGDQQSAKSNEGYLRNLILMGHESVLEHVSWSFVAVGISRALTHQIVRHRVGFAFSQLSQQYQDQSEATFLAPSQLTHPRALAAWKRAIETARESYKEIMEVLRSSEAPTNQSIPPREVLRAMRSAARSVLPNATETKLFLTANARALRHFLAVRGSIVGDEEMRVFATELLKLVRQEAPALFFDFQIEELSDGSPVVRKVAV
jgi:thymidylate synthase (FAD)